MDGRNARPTSPYRIRMVGIYAVHYCEGIMKKEKYYCTYCGHEVEIGQKSKDKGQCSNCGWRILKKE